MSDHQRVQPVRGTGEYGDQEPEEPIIQFTPVPRLRKRRGGWTEDNQRAFIAALAQCGSVARAARSVGLTPRSAYRLMDAEGADDFARAWDEAYDMGKERVRIEALDRALHGYRAEIYRRGKLVRVEQRFNDRLAIALLNGKDREIAAYRRTAVSRRAYYQDLRAHDEEKRQREEAYQAEIDEIMRRAAERRKPNPRIVAL